jgi:hypothetical protein
MIVRLSLGGIGFDPLQKPEIDAPHEQIQQILMFGPLARSSSPRRSFETNVDQIRKERSMIVRLLATF